MRIWKQFTSRNDCGGVYEVQLQDWGENEKPRYRVTVGYEDGGIGLTNYFYSFDYDDEKAAVSRFIGHCQ